MADAEMNTAADTEELKEEFWIAAAKSPFVLVSRDGVDEHAIPMRMQLDEDAKSAIWFFTSRGGRPGDDAICVKGPRPVRLRIRKPDRGNQRFGHRQALEQCG